MAVIEGNCTCTSPASYPSHHSGAPRSDEPGMTEVGGALRRAYPIAVKAVGNPMAQLHQRDRAGFDIGGIEHCEVAAVFAAAPDHRQQPAVALGGILAAGDEHRLGKG